MYKYEAFENEDISNVAEMCLNVFSRIYVLVTQPFLTSFVADGVMGNLYWAKARTCIIILSHP